MINIDIVVPKTPETAPKLSIKPQYLYDWLKITSGMKIVNVI
jgi:hypothetical protein